MKLTLVAKRLAVDLPLPIFTFLVIVTNDEIIPYMEKYFDVVENKRDVHLDLILWNHSYSLGLRFVDCQNCFVRGLFSSFCHFFFYQSPCTHVYRLEIQFKQYLYYTSKMYLPIASMLFVYKCQNNCFLCFISYK